MYALFYNAGKKKTPSWELWGTHHDEMELKRVQREKFADQKWDHAVIVGTLHPLTSKDKEGVDQFAELARKILDHDHAFTEEMLELWVEGIYEA